MLCRHCIATAYCLLHGFARVLCTPVRFRLASTAPQCTRFWVSARGTRCTQVSLEGSINLKTLSVVHPSHRDICGHGVATLAVCMSVIAPSAYVCPCAACAVVAKCGARGNCRRTTRSIGRRLPLSKCQTCRWSVTGKTFSLSSPWARHFVLVWNCTKTQAGGWFQICDVWPSDVAWSLCQLHPITSPGHPFSMPLRRSRWSVAVTGMPMHKGSTPYSPPHSRS